MTSDPREAGPDPLVEVLHERQRTALARWRSALEADEQAAGNESREQRLEARRRTDALRRTYAAASSRVDRALAEVLAHGAPRAVVAHRQEWLRAKIASGLAKGKLRVVAELDDGADALGVAVAEQPDLVVLEDRLSSVTVPEVVQALRELAPQTLTAVQVADDRGAEALLVAGADAVFPRRVPPAELCAELLRLLGARAGTAEG